MSDLCLKEWVDTTREILMIKHDQTDSMILKDSVINGHRVTCFLINFPRIVNAEVLRHRAFSFCSSSSRAIPGNRMKDQFSHYVPTRYSEHQPGMQPKEPQFEGEFFDRNDRLWRRAKKFNEAIVKRMIEGGLAKEQANRWLETSCYITLLVQGSDKGFQNFFELRCDPTAQYEIRELALMMRDQYYESKPTPRVIHLPFVDEPSVSMEHVYKSVARSARTSYMKEGREPTLEEDVNLYRRLVEAWPPHLSPTEFPVFSAHFLHTLGVLPDWYMEGWPTTDLSGNLNMPVVQYRKLLEPQNRKFGEWLHGTNEAWNTGIFPGT